MDNNINANAETNKKNKAVKTVILMIAATALSKSLGLFRNIFMADLYGGSDKNAAFVTASRIPLSFFDILLGAAILGAFIPFYNSFEKESKEQKAFSDVFISVVFILTSVLAFFGIVFSEQIILFIAPAYIEDAALLQMSSDFLKILFPMIIFAGATYTLIGVLQSEDEFLVPALVSSVSNAGIIAYFLLLNRYFDIYGLCVTYTISWGVQLATLIVPLYKKGYRFRFRFNLKNKELVNSLKASLPIIAGSWFLPVSSLIGNHFASGMKNKGAAVSAFDYANSLFLIITGILAYGICNYIFPKLSQLSFLGNEDEYYNTVKNGISITVFIIIPAACVSFLLRNEMIAVLYERGEFTSDMTELTSQFFLYMVPTMIFFSLNEVLNRVFYSKKKPLIPMMAVLAGIGVNFILSHVFIKTLHLPAQFIALANSLGQFTIILILFVFFIKYFKKAVNFNFIFNIIKMFVSAALTLSGISFMTNNSFIANILANKTGFAFNLIYCTIIFALVCIIYLILNFILKTNEIKEFKSLLLSSKMSKLKNKERRKN